MKKTVQKSIRLSEDVLAYIEAAPGDGFNNKFENIILSAKRTEPERRRKIDEYDLLIEKRKRQLEQIVEKVETLDITVQAIFSLQSEVRKIQDQLASILKDDS